MGRASLIKPEPRVLTQAELDWVAYRVRTRHNKDKELYSDEEFARLISKPISESPIYAWERDNARVKAHKFQRQEKKRRMEMIDSEPLGNIRESIKEYLLNGRTPA